MSRSKTLAIVFWIVVVAAPFVASLLAVSIFPPNADVPLHWNTQGEIDGWGSAWIWLPLSLIMVGTNLFAALCYAFSDVLYDRGLVHGVSRKNTRPFLCGTALFIVAVWVAILVFWVATALPLVS